MAFTSEDVERDQQLLHALSVRVKALQDLVTFLLRSASATHPAAVQNLHDQLVALAAAPGEDTFANERVAVQLTMVQAARAG
jgi:hypothetical protein